MSQSQVRVAVIFGGASAEHDVSIMSAASILKYVDVRRFSVSLIGLDRQNRPYLVPHLDSIVSHDVFSNKDNVALDYPALTKFLIDQSDVVFPIIHGPGGEDGQLQGYLKFMGIPFVGADVTASAVCMDKRIAKEILRANGFKQAPYLSFTKRQYQEGLDHILTTVDNHLKYPVFVKPCNLGSSLGIHKVVDPSLLEQALIDAFTYDSRILIEQGINARELECGVLGNDRPRAMAVGEIVASHEFYDYEAKYSDACPSTLTVPANAPAEVISTIQEESLRAYEILGVEGLARVDFLVDKDDFTVYLSELNTLPGFTKFSMYPTLCAQMGISYSDLITQLIDLALERHGLSH